MKYYTTCYIDFFDDGIKLDNPIKYKLKEAEIEIKSVDFNRLIVNTTSSINNDNYIYSILEEISNIFCFFQGIPIKSYYISTKSKVIDKDSSETIAITELSEISEKVSYKKTIGNNRELKNKLIYTNNNRELHEDISLYKEAISKKDSVSKYLLLYRLFDSLFHSKLVDMTAWIKLKEPNIRIYPRNRKRPERTLYTELRDIIAHMKSRTKLPYKDILNSTGKLDRLIKLKIKELYNL